MSGEKTMEREESRMTINGADPTSCLEVVVRADSQGKRKIELRRLLWGEGVGWYCQQTLRLNLNEAEDLFWALRGSRNRWRDRPASEQGKVIPFPVQPTDVRGQRLHRSGKAPKKRTGSPSYEPPVAEKKRTKQGEERSVTSRA
jgi:hypothetical protein